MIKTQLLDLIRKIRSGGNSPQNLADSLDALTNNPPYTGVRVVNELPTTLASGEQVVYQNALWIGNAQGEAWPAVGYKEYSAFMTQTGTDGPVATIAKNEIGNVVWTYVSEGLYNGTLNGAFQSGKTFMPQGQITVLSVDDNAYYSVSRLDNNSVALSSQIGLDGVNSILAEKEITIRIYP